MSLSGDIDCNRDWDNEEEIVSELTLIGIVGIQDPVRPEVSDLSSHTTHTLCLISARSHPEQTAMSTSPCPYMDTDFLP